MSGSVDSRETAQLAVCAQFGVEPVSVHPDDKVGIARNVRTGLLPIHGIRHLPDNGTCGWYIWAGGEMSQADDFFVPLHVAHLPDWTARVMPYLLLPPGWRFLLGANNYADVWFDPDVDVSPLRR